MSENIQDTHMDEAAAPRARWYILHTYSGFENRVEQTIRELMRQGQDQGLIEEVVVPTEKVIELVNGAKKTSTRKFYPGYVMIRMIMTDFSWHPAPGYVITLTGSEALSANPTSFAAFNAVLSSVVEEWKMRSTPFWIFYVQDDPDERDAHSEEL